jgi:transposase
MSKYDKAFKLAAVQRCLTNKVSSSKLSSQLGIDKSMLRRWIEAYRVHGHSAFDKKYSHYTARFKLSVLQYIKTHKVSNQQAAANFDIRNPPCITVWARQYTAGGIAALEPQRRGRPKVSRKVTCPPDEQRSQKELLEELTYLRAENAYLKKLDALIREEEAAQNKKRKRSKD